jgi:hypothetical protein
MKKRYIIMLALTAYVAWSYFHVPEPTVLSVRIGLPFDEVVRTSTFPVTASSNTPMDDPDGFGTTIVSTPAVIINFNDPEYGFTLPATTFAGISYSGGKVATIRTSPMLRKLPFDKAFAELTRLQRQFQSAGWRLDDGTSWFDLSPTGRIRLHEDLRSEEDGHTKIASLVAPGKYSLYFMISCAGRCDSRIGLDRYLIDISIGQDFAYEIDIRKRLLEEAMTP